MSNVSRRNLSGAIEDLSLTLTKQYIKATIDKIEYASEDLETALRPTYLGFFDEVLKVIIEAQDLDPEEGGAPARIEQYSRGSAASWQPLSESWMATKSLYTSFGFYDGISGKARLQRVSGRDTRKNKAFQKGNLSSTPFKSYIKGLSNEAESILGKLAIEYTFKAPDRQFVVKNLDNVIEIQEVLSTKTNKKVTFPSKFRLTVRVLGFQNLLGTQLEKGMIEEWAIVDKLANLTGHAEQWRKINARTAWGRGRRPVRAIMAPMISWWFNEIATPALVAFMKDLEGK